jgi:hypothetical protein
VYSSEAVSGFVDCASGRCVHLDTLFYDTGYSVVITLNRKHDNRETQIKLVTPTTAQFYGLSFVPFWVLPEFAYIILHGMDNMNVTVAQSLNHNNVCTVVPPYTRVIRSKTYRGYVKPRIIPNAIQGDSGGICNTLRKDSMCDSKQKSSYEHGSDFERLPRYGKKKIRTIPRARTAVT